MKLLPALLMVMFAIMAQFVFANGHGVPGKTSLSGKITDKNTGLSLPGVYVSIPDLKTGALSDTNGFYKIENLPEAKVQVNLSYIGYKPIAEVIDLAITITKDFQLEEAVNELNEIVVTGLAVAVEKNRTPTPIAPIPHQDLIQKSATNIVDAIAAQPGVSQVTTGAGISKPVIRGLGFNRVVTVMDGIRQEGQQWGDEHGIEIDEYAVSKVELLKGPATMTYGSDAMAGVINMLSAPSLPDGKTSGSILSNYQTNNGLIAFSGDLASNRNGLVWDARYSQKAAHAYQNALDGYVFNSGFREQTAATTFGLNKSWGYAHLILSFYHMKPGIVEGARDSTTGQFVKSIKENDSLSNEVLATTNDFKSYLTSVPFQQVRHMKAVFNNSFIIGDGSLKAVLGWQRNQRQEYGDILHPDQYGLYFQLNTYNYDFRYLFPEKNDFDLAIGVNGMRQVSENKGIEFLIPDYKLFDVGGFITAKKSLDKLDLNGGIRFDSRNEDGEALYLNENGEPVVSNDPGAYEQFAPFSATFSGWSGSMGLSYQFSEAIYAKLNASRGFRAPNIAELASNGVHEGTLNYIIGSTALKPEHSLQLDFALGANSNHITAELDLFSNHIHDFIFLSKLNSVISGDSLTDGYSTFIFSSGDAVLTGGEFSVDIHPHPLDWLHFENAISFVNSIQRDQPDSTKYLPFTPAPKISSELKANAKRIGNRLVNAYVQVEVENYFSQNHFYSAFNTETKTPGYTLLNIGIGADFISTAKRTVCSLYINASNVTDVVYQSHLSRLKYADVNPVTGKPGVFNMGRNISFKLIVPFDLPALRNLK